MEGVVTASTSIRCETKEPLLPITEVPAFGHESVQANSTTTDMAIVIAKAHRRAISVYGRIAQLARTIGVHSCRAVFFFFQAEDGIRDLTVTGVQTCALPI